MPSVVSYGAVANVRTQLVIEFTTSGPATRILLQAPATFVLSCMTDPLWSLSLSGANCSEDPLTITVTEPFVGDIAFALQADLPSTTPDNCTFNLLVEDANEVAVDAAYGVLGKSLEDDFGMGVIADSGIPWISDATLIWSHSGANSTSLITMWITFAFEVKVIKAVLITLPSGFAHIVTSPYEMKISRRFPLHPTTWLEYAQADSLKVLVDDTGILSISAGEYSFSFSVTVPSSMSWNNIWHISLCTLATCSSPTDETVFVSFPLAGFGIGDSYDMTSAVGHFGFIPCFTLAFWFHWRSVGVL